MVPVPVNVPDPPIVLPTVGLNSVLEFTVKLPVLIVRFEVHIFVAVPLPLPFVRVKLL